LAKPFGIEELTARIGAAVPERKDKPVFRSGMASTLAFPGVLPEAPSRRWLSISEFRRITSHVRSGER
ncbi:MAG: hypothetical protein WA579_06705, partial [Rhodomicrobium sp.]